MLTVTCSCCGHETHSDAASPTFLQTWPVQLAQRDEPEPGSQVVPTWTLRLCLGCRADLAEGNYEGLASKARRAGRD